MKQEIKLHEVIFFSIDQTNKKIKQYSQKKFSDSGLDITIDQWVLLKLIDENPDISQTRLAELAVKDTASVTRILDILEKKKLLSRNNNSEDRRKFTISMTEDGKNFITKHMPLVLELRKQGIKGINGEDLKTLRKLLKKIAENME